ncbi:MAG: hypothetical protein LBL59_12185 [Xanthomonadaceae bacterium]|jgi:hypothetical protein|nr:hypothetical protein [Xanthomonadaceae bacterium]
MAHRGAQDKDISFHHLLQFLEDDECIMDRQHLMLSTINNVLFLGTFPEWVRFVVDDAMADSMRHDREQAPAYVIAMG